MTRQTRPIEWVIAIAGGLALAALLVWLLRGDDFGANSGPPARAVPVAPAPPAVAAAPPQAAIRAGPPAATLPEPPAADIDLSAVKLRGIVNRPSGATAMIETTGGRQRLVRIGSVVMPGVKVTAIGPDAITLMTGASAQVLRFDGATASVTTPVPTGSTPAPGLDPRIAALAATSADWRMGLAAEKRDGRTIGYRVADSARLPLLRRAGLQRGDILTAINGNGLTSEEKIIDLPAEISGAYTVELSYVRGGTARTTSVPLNR